MYFSCSLLHGDSWANVPEGYQTDAFSILMHFSGQPTWTANFNRTEPSFPFHTPSFTLPPHPSYPSFLIPFLLTPPSPPLFPPRMNLLNSLCPLPPTPSSTSHRFCPNYINYNIYHLYSLIRFFFPLFPLFLLTLSLFLSFFF